MRDSEAKEKGEKQQPKKYKIFFCLTIPRKCFYNFCLFFFMGFNIGAIVLQARATKDNSFPNNFSPLIVINCIFLVANFCFLLSVFVMTCKSQKNFSNKTLLHFQLFYTVVSLIYPILFLLISLLKLKESYNLTFENMKDRLKNDYLKILVLFVGTYLSFKMYFLARYFYNLEKKQ